MLRVSYESSDEHGVTVVTIKGDAGLAGAPELDQAMLRVSASKPDVMIFDVSELTFVSSLAMGSMVAASHPVIHRGGRCYLVGASPAIATVITRCRLNRIFNLCATVGEARAKEEAIAAPAHGPRRRAS